MLALLHNYTLTYRIGFSENGCKRAAIAVSNENVEAAMNWIFEHMEDTGESSHTCIFTYTPSNLMYFLLTL